MGKVMHDVSPSLRSPIAAVLAKSNTGNALVVTARGLLDDDPRVIETTARSLAMEIPAYTPAQRTALAKFLIESLQAKNIPPKSETGLLRVLSALQEGKADEISGRGIYRLMPPMSGPPRCKPWATMRHRRRRNDCKHCWCRPRRISRSSRQR